VDFCSFFDLILQEKHLQNISRHVSDGIVSLKSANFAARNKSKTDYETNSIEFIIHHLQFIIQRSTDHVAQAVH